MLEYYIKKDIGEEDNDEKQFDFYEDQQFDDLVDIRTNSSYKRMAAKALEDESVWKEENGWSLFTKDYRVRILDNVSALMAL